MPVAAAGSGRERKSAALRHTANLLALPRTYHEPICWGCARSPMMMQAIGNSPLSSCYSLLHRAAIPQFQSLAPDLSFARAHDAQRHLAKLSLPDATPRRCLIGN